MFAYVRKITYLSVATPPINIRHMAKHRLTTRKPWTYDTKVIDLRHESHRLTTRKPWTYDSKVMDL